MDAGAEVFDYGNSIRARGRARRLRARLGLPGLRPGLHPAAVLRGQGPVPLGGALRRPGRHPRDRRGGPRAVPGQRPAVPLDPQGAREASRSRGCPRASAGSATASATAPALRFNEMVADGTLKAPIVIGRDHLDCGSVASPYRETEAMRDGSRRDRRLAAAQRARQHRVGRVVGLDPPRRRRRHRPLDPRGAGDGRRRHAARGREDRARADERPGHGRHPPRRRGLRRARSRSPRSAACASRCGGGARAQ